MEKLGAPEGRSVSLKVKRCLEDETVQPVDPAFSRQGSPRSWRSWRLLLASAAVSSATASCLCSSLQHLGALVSEQNVLELP